jgi:hypothetical protein
MLFDRGMIPRPTKIVIEPDAVLDFFAHMRVEDVVRLAEQFVWRALRRLSGPDRWNMLAEASFWLG